MVIKFDKRPRETVEKKAKSRYIGSRGTRLGGIGRQKGEKRNAPCAEHFATEMPPRAIFFTAAPDTKLHWVLSGETTNASRRVRNDTRATEKEVRCRWGAK